MNGDLFEVIKQKREALLSANTWQLHKAREEVTKLQAAAAVLARADDRVASVFDAVELQGFVLFRTHDTYSSIGSQPWCVLDVQARENYPAMRARFRIYPYPQIQIWVSGRSRGGYIFTASHNKRLTVRNNVVKVLIK